MKTRILLGAVGVLMICFAVFDAVGSPDLRVSQHLIRLVAVLIFHDVVWMAIVAAAGTMIHRAVSGRYRAIIQGATIVTASVTVVAAPFLTGFGRTTLVPSALPRNYAGGYAIILGAIWLLAAGLIVRRHLATRPARAPGAQDDPTSPAGMGSAGSGRVG